MVVVSVIFRGDALSVTGLFLIEVFRSAPGAEAAFSSCGLNTGLLDDPLVSSFADSDSPNSFDTVLLPDDLSEAGSESEFGSLIEGVLPVLVSVANGLVIL